VTVPAAAIALISIRARTKFKGLVNVSGFHVDPGYRGQLTFAVFNAGPVPIHIRRGQPIFLIWYARLHVLNSP
jgi:dCTP deaminase